MSDNSAIEWTDATWNPVTGCTKVSPGCDHCYAETFAERWRGTSGHYFERGFDVQLRPDKLTLPLRWRKPRKVFVNSMSDLFHSNVPDEFIARVFAVVAATPEHTYQVLTKRHGRMRSLLSRGSLGTEGFPDMVEEAMAEFTHAALDAWPLCDGRTPEQVDVASRWLSNSRLAKCSHVLKQIPCRAWMDVNADPDTSAVYVGIDWTEQHREPDIRRFWAPWKVEMPLTRPPYRDKAALLALARSVGLEPPRMYRMGFPHANCGGTCPRGGQAQHELLLRVFPERFAQREQHEARMRVLLDADVAILRGRVGGVTTPLPLTVLRHRIEQSDEGTLGFDELDWGGCGCFTDSGDAA